jgi:hypothetical protein
LIRERFSSRQKIILDLCGGSGSWSRPYKRAGYDVRVIDIVQGNDVRSVPVQENVYGILAAPPCTVFATAGNRWPRTQDQIRDALSVVDACLRIAVACRPRFWALENPTGKLRRYLGPPRFAFNPCDFGDPYTKRTLLWGNFNFPKLSPVYPSEGSKMHHRVRDPAKRAITPEKFAKAFMEANR